MAGSKGGFITFLLVLISIVGAFFLGAGAIMMFSPDVSIFGVSYITNKEKVVISEIKIGGQQQNLFMEGYKKIIIQTQNADVSIAYGKANANESNFILDKNSAGFYKEGSATEYSYTLTAQDDTLKFVLKEPEYSFLTVTSSSRLYVNLSINEDNLGKQFEIQTTTGNISLGVATSASEVMSQFSASKINAITEKGNISVSDKIDITDTLNVETTNGKITVSGNLNAENLSFSSQNGRIEAKNILNEESNLVVKSDTSHIVFGDIAGDIYVDVKNGIFEAKKLGGSIATPNTVVSTKFYISEVGGDVQIANLNGQLGVTIDKVKGAVNISTNSGNVKLNEVHGQTYVATTSANIKVNVADDNSSDINLKTKDGKITVDFKKIDGQKNITTESGDIKISTPISVAYKLSAISQKGKVVLEWEDVTFKSGEIISRYIGDGPLQGDDLTISTVSGDISIERYAA